MAVSQNGWPVNPKRTNRTVPGTSVRLTVADGPAGDVLMYVAREFDRRVEDIDTARGGVPDDWGYANRPIRGGTATSNHASATAIDLNATRHPLGRPGTFTGPQLVEISNILHEVDYVVRWGGNYTGRVDPMHFEINANQAAVAKVAAKLADQEEQEMSWEKELAFDPDGPGPKPGHTYKASTWLLWTNYYANMIPGLVRQVLQLQDTNRVLAGKLEEVREFNATIYSKLDEINTKLGQRP